MIALEDDEIAVEGGRAAVSPLGLKRRVFLAEMTRPDDPPGHVEHHDLSVAEPGVDALPVGAGVGVARLCFSCRSENGPVARVRTPTGVGRPIAGMPRRRARSRCRPDRTCPTGVRTSAANRSLALGERTVVTRELGMPAAAGRTVLPTCDVTMTRSPQTMGEEVPRPASGARQARFSLAPHVVGRPASCDTPRLDGPRHCGQFSAASSAPDRTSVASQTAEVRWIEKAARRMRCSVPLPRLAADAPAPRRRNPLEIEAALIHRARHGTRPRPRRTPS